MPSCCTFWWPHSNMQACYWQGNKSYIRSHIVMINYSHYNCLLYFSKQEKSSSHVKLPDIEKKSPGGGERFQAKNWKMLSKKEIQKLPPQQRSKYLAVRKAFYMCNVGLSKDWPHTNKKTLYTETNAKTLTKNCPLITNLDLQMGSNIYCFLTQ